MAYYTPGNEPENIRKRLATFFARIDEYYPDGEIIGLHIRHKKLGERLTELYRLLGYADAKEMMEAYGYKYTIRRHEAKYTEEDKALRKKNILEKLKALVGDNPKKSKAEVYECYPELSGEIINSGVTFKDLFEAGIVREKPHQNERFIRKQTMVDDIKKLSEYIRTNYPDMEKVYDLDTSKKKVPEKKEEIERLENEAKELKYNLRMSLMKKKVLYREQKKTKKTKGPDDIDVGTIRRYLMLDYEKFPKNITQNEFGLAYSDFRKKYDPNMPQGKILKSINQLKNLFKKAPESNLGIVSEQYVEENIDELKSLAKLLGYSSLDKMLSAFSIIEDADEDFYEDQDEIFDIDDDDNDEDEYGDEIIQEQQLDSDGETTICTPEEFMEADTVKISAESMNDVPLTDAERFKAALLQAVNPNQNRSAVISPADKPAPKPVSPAPVKAEAAAPQVASAEYIPPVFPPRINDLEIKRFYEYTDPFADVNGKEFAVFIDEFYYASCIDYLNRNGAKVVLCPSENTDYILVELPNNHKAFYYAHKVGFKGKFTLVDDIKKYLTEEEREYYHYCEDVVGFEFSYEPKMDFERSCELMYAVYDVVLGELNKCRTRPYGESIRYVTSITSCLGSSKPDYSYNDMIDWIKGKEADDNFDKYEQLIYGMSFEDKLCAVMYALARYEWTGYEDDESMCDFAYKLTQKWFRKKEKPKLKEKITEDVAYLRLKFKDIDKSERFDGIGLKYYVPYVDLMRFEWAKDRLCVVARTDKKQKVLKSDVFSAQQGDVNLYVCYAANPEKDEYYYLDNTQPFQWRMTPVEIWNAAKEKIVWFSKKEMPANIPERIDTSISELEELGKNGRKKMLDKIKKQAAQLEKYTHKIDPESVPCFADLGAVIKELEENKAKIQQQADAVEAELRAVDSKLREAFDQQNAQVPSSVKKKDTEAEIARLTDEKSHLGFFKGKQKKALQAQIDELNAQLPQLDSAIAAEKQDQKAKYDPIITELGVQKSQLQQRLKELKDLIAEADSTIESLKFN